jgi:hypothetical protein
MNRLFLTAAFLFVLWRVLAPAEPQVPPSLEAAAIRIVHEVTPSERPARAAEGPVSNRLKPETLRQIGDPSPNSPQFARPAPY